jgi:hypothetical protein
MKTFWLIFFSAAWPLLAQTNGPVAVTNLVDDRQSEVIRQACIDGRRCICGKVIQITHHGLVIESGDTALLNPPFNQNWIISGGPVLKRDKTLIEHNEPASPCIGTVFLSDLPQRPKAKLYDYIVLQGYPAGAFEYTPVEGVHKTIRAFAGGLDTAVWLKLAAAKSPAVAPNETTHFRPATP